MVASSGCTPDDPLEGAPLDALEDLAAQVERDRLMGHVNALVDAHDSDIPLDCGGFSTTYPPDCFLTSALAGAYMRSELEALGFYVDSHDTADDIAPTSTLIADLPGTSHPEEVVLIGAHYDAFYSGADDNSSGVAVVLETARVLSTFSFPRTVRFVGFDLEEWGLIGSTRYVEQEVVNSDLEQVVAVLVLDAVGFARSEPQTQLPLPGFPMGDVGDFIGIVSNTSSASLAEQTFALSSRVIGLKALAVLSSGDGDVPLAGDLLRSDHAPFWLEGIPGVFLTDTADFRNPDYHEVGDTPGKLNDTFLWQVAQLATTTVALWAGGPQ